MHNNYLSLAITYFAGRNGGSGNCGNEEMVLENKVPRYIMVLGVLVYQDGRVDRPANYHYHLYTKYH